MEHTSINDARESMMVNLLKGLGLDLDGDTFTVVSRGIVYDVEVDFKHGTLSVVNLSMKED